MASINRPNNPCKNTACGNTLFVSGYDDIDGKFSPSWQCTNCTWIQPRQLRHRRTNKIRAFDVYLAIRKEWEETDKQLDALCAIDNPNRIPNGAIMVHGSLFNYHLGRLSGSLKLSNWSIKYHASEARKALEQAKEFVKSKEVQA